jgi:glycine cleavage system regulatory protein
MIGFVYPLYILIKTGRYEEIMSARHEEIFDAIKGEYARQSKGGVLSSSVAMLKSMVDTKMRAAISPAAKAEMKNTLLQVSALCIKMLEQL